MEKQKEITVLIRKNIFISNTIREHTEYIILANAKELELNNSS